jgi:hypothetical protein
MNNPSSDAVSKGFRFNSKPKEQDTKKTITTQQSQHRSTMVSTQNNPTPTPSPRGYA